jgi:HEAT repeat protein
LARLRELTWRRADLADPESGTRRAARAAVSTLEGLAGLAQLMDALRDDSALVRRVALERLVATGRRELVQLLVMAIADEEPDVRALAASRFEELEPERQQKLILDGLDDADIRVRAGACRWIERLRFEPARSELRKRLFAEQDPGVLRAACDAVIALEDVEGARIVRRLVDMKATEARLAACRVFGALGDRSDMDFLARLAFDLEESVRIAACLALGRLGYVDARMHLERMTRHQPRPVVLAARAALGRLGDRDAVAMLLADATAARDDASLQALVEAGADVGIPVLSAALQAPALEARSLACDVLGLLGDQRGVFLLASVLDDESWEVRRAATVALGRLSDRDAVPALIECLHDANPLVSGAAHDALAGLGEARLSVAVARALEGRPEQLVALQDPRAVSAILGALGSPIPEIRAAACRMLGTLPGGGHVDALMDALLDDAEQVRVEACAALATRPQESVLVALVGLLREGEDPTRTAAWNALQRIGFERATEPLLDLARVGGPTGRATAAVALGLTGQPSLVDPLARMARRDEHDGVRVAACESLARLGPTAGPALVRLLEVPIVDEKVMELLTHLEPAEALLEPLLAWTRHEDELVRAAVLTLLGRRMLREGLPEILRALLDEAPDVQASSRLALLRFGEAELGSACFELFDGRPELLIELEEPAALMLVARTLLEAPAKAVDAAATLLGVQPTPVLFGAVLGALEGQRGTVELLQTALVGLCETPLTLAEEWALSPADPAPAVAMGLLDRLAGAATQSWLPVPIRDRVASIMAALRDRGDLLYCTTHSQPLVDRTVRTGLLGRMKLRGCATCGGVSTLAARS